MRILILTASVGAGHLRAAEAVELALKQLAPTAHIRNVDVLTCATAAFKRLYGKAYLDLVNKAPHLLGYFYDLTDRAPDPHRKRDKFKLLLERANLTKLTPILNERWDAIASTHFLPAEILSRLRRKSSSSRRTQSSVLSPQHSPPLLTVVTDFDAHGLWANDPTDHYFVATDEAALSLQRWGVDPTTIAITGIPIHPVFAEPKTAAACRDKHNLPRDRPVVLLLAGGFGVGPIEHLFQAALQTKTPIHLAVVCGKNEALKKKLSALTQSSVLSPQHSTTILGFTRDMDELLAAADIIISKPGGLTTSEVLARGAALAIVNPIPGQESRNSDYLLERGAAIKINSSAILPHKLDALLTDPAKLRALRQNAHSLGHPTAALDVARHILHTIPAH